MPKASTDAVWARPTSETRVAGPHGKQSFGVLATVPSRRPSTSRRRRPSAPGIFEEAFWLCGAHAGLRLPGEAQGLTWGMTDFDVSVIRPHGNWVLNKADTTKTANFTPIPMTARLSRVLQLLKQRDVYTGDDDFVFASDCGRPGSSKALRELFMRAVSEAGLKQIPMYNLRHSFGTASAGTSQSSIADVRQVLG
jgi:integrase